MKPFYEGRNESMYIGDIYNQPFPVHLHPVVEIICITSGTAEITIGSKKHVLTPGDIAVAFPMVLHSYGRISPDADGVTLIFLPDVVKDYMRVFQDTRPLSAFIPASAVSDEFAAVIRLLGTFHGNVRQSTGSAYIHLFLAHLFEIIETSPIEKSSENDTIERVISYITSHYSEQMTLDTVSRELKLSRSHLSHMFSQHLRISFRSYVNMLRIDRAVLLMNEDPGMSLTDIGYTCGYEDIRTFRRAFLRETGTTPGKYRIGLVEAQHGGGHSKR